MRALTIETFAHIHGKQGNSFPFEASNLMDGIAAPERQMPAAYGHSPSGFLNLCRLKISAD